MCASSSSRTEAFFSASGAALSQEVADGKISVQSPCALNTVYILLSWRAVRVIFLLKSGCTTPISYVLSSYQPRLFPFDNTGEAGG
jgi:hypothetical protein